ncbi:MAG: hypothetical protein K6E59_01200 [Bacilli bacterium]|nr:hypothetical protein [Bacilli bacterium]
MRKHLPWIDLAFDATILFLAAFSATWMAMGNNGILAEAGIGFLKYFTVQSNILLGVVAGISLPFDILLLTKQRKASPLPLRIAYLSAMVGTSLTFLVTMSFLGPMMGYGTMFQDSLLFMHLIIPLLGIARVLFFETNEEKPRWQWAFFGVIHMGLYGIYYTINVAVHNGYGQLEYDWYMFGQSGLAIGLGIFVCLLCLVFFASFGLVKLQALILAKRR